MECAVIRMNLLSDRRAEMKPRLTCQRIIPTHPDRYTGHPVEPTPEQSRDDGRVDGIPIITPTEAAQRCADRLRAITAHCVGYKARTTNATKSIRVRLVPVDGGEAMEFDTMKAAAKEFGISEANVRAKLRREGGVIAGYRWVIG
jgi:hypothetical protein